MPKKVICTLSEKEFEVIEDLFEKKVALENLTKIIDAENTALYDKLVSDYGKVTRKYNDWWGNLQQQFQWNGKTWWLNFDTHEVLEKDA